MEALALLQATLQKRILANIYTLSYTGYPHFLWIKTVQV
ncbi:Hypothetical protein ABZS17H1_04650 (plasmid) [Kosakonia cowanii]